VEETCCKWLLLLLLPMGMFLGGTGGGAALTTGVDRCWRRGLLPLLGLLFPTCRDTEEEEGCSTTKNGSAAN
jgi:hypothetical protein